MLGASNLTRAFPTAVSLALNVFAGPINIYVAKGLGRSYGKKSSCFGRKISGIFQCGIWQELAQENSVPISACLTDIGNDLAYEEPVEQVIGWVEACVDRLEALRTQIVLTDLPIEVLRTVSTTQYAILHKGFEVPRLTCPEGSLCQFNIENTLRKRDTRPGWSRRFTKNSHLNLYERKQEMMVHQRQTRWLNSRTSCEPFVVFVRIHRNCATLFSEKICFTRRKKCNFRVVRMLFSVCEVRNREKNVNQYKKIFDPSRNLPCGCDARLENEKSDHSAGRNPRR